MFAFFGKCMGKSDPRRSKSVVNRGGFAEVAAGFFRLLGKEVIRPDGEPCHCTIGISRDELMRKIKQLVFSSERVEAGDMERKHRKVVRVIVKNPISARERVPNTER